ncbi:DUF3822 family protein [Pedobacter sp. AW1-32]|uniref:DUF3822 family protein n=1 Tax=Pedobacter sp. AW1-32 TaxID=3383026 RepID=UPI003FF0CAFF
MSRNSLLLVDPNFSHNNHAGYHLLLKITNDSFSYAVIDGKLDKVCVLFDKQNCQDLAHEIQQAFATDQNLSIAYDSIKAAVYTTDYLFIPTEWFDKDNLSIYQNYFSNTTDIFSKSNSKMGFETVFSVPSEIRTLLPENTQIFSQSCALLSIRKQLDKASILIDFTASSFNFLYLKDGNVQFQNHYQIDNDEEFNYFILLIIAQLQLNDAIPVYLQGIINEDDEVYNCLLKYFNQLYFFLPNGLENSDLLADMPKHYFSGLLALDLCE